MSDRLRAFVAIELPPAVRSTLGGLRQTFGLPDRRLRWVDPGNLHLTLKFLGDMPRDRVVAVTQALTDAVGGHAPITLQAGGLGVFPGPRRPRVLWVGVGGDKQALHRLQQDVEAFLAPLGWPPEKRPFRGHLTIARFKQAVDARRLVQALTDSGEFRSEAFRIADIHLMRSTLNPAGAVYTRLASIGLAGSPQDDATVARDGSGIAD
jgi:2'-5' RNA ligase